MRGASSRGARSSGSLVWARSQRPGGGGRRRGRTWRALYPRSPGLTRPTSTACRRSTAVRGGSTQDVDRVVDTRRADRFQRSPVRVGHVDALRRTPRPPLETTRSAPDLLLGPMLRHVDRTSATIWVETDAPCTVEVCGRTARTFTVHGHHYALVVIEGLDPGSTTTYEVALDGVRRWPIDGSTLPASTIRTIGTAHGDQPVRLAFGSCRASAPHVPPYTSRLDDHADGRGVDALRALGLRMLDQPVDQWPDLLLMAGDQVYADDSSPGTAARLERRRSNGSTAAPPDGVVADFEEYTWLYRESWTPEIERWLFSTVPSAMIFDDHDMIDDWNISRSWVDDIRDEPWWADHIVGGAGVVLDPPAPGEPLPRSAPRGGHARALRRARRRHRVSARLGAGLGGVHAGPRRLPVQLRPTPR